MSSTSKEKKPADIQVSSPKHRVVPTHTLPASRYDATVVSPGDINDMVFLPRGKRSPLPTPELEGARSSSSSSRSPSLRPQRHKSADTDHDIPLWLLPRAEGKPQQEKESDSSADWAVRFRNMRREAELSPKTEEDKELQKKEHIMRLHELQKFSKALQLTTPVPADIAEIFHPHSDLTASSKTIIQDNDADVVLQNEPEDEQELVHPMPTFIQPPSPEPYPESGFGNPVSSASGLARSMIFGGLGLGGTPPRRPVANLRLPFPSEEIFSSPALSEPNLYSSDEDEDEDDIFDFGPSTSVNHSSYHPDINTGSGSSEEASAMARRVSIRRGRLRSSENLIMARSVPGSYTDVSKPIPSYLANSPLLQPIDLPLSPDDPQPSQTLASVCSPTDHATLVALWSKLVKMSEAVPTPPASSSSTSEFITSSCFDTAGHSHTKTRVDKNAFPTLDWTDFLTQDEEGFIGGGNFGDVYKGKWIGVAKVLEQNLKRQARGEIIMSPDSPVPSARAAGVEVGMGLSLKELPRIVIKVMRTPQVTQKKAEKRFKQLKREIRVWHNLNHPNIVPFVGLTHARGGKLPSLVSVWMSNGSSKEYIKTPGVCRLWFLNGIAKGLYYLHTFKPQIIHGDLKGDNVLVDETGHPRLGDFGLSRMMEKDQSLWQTSATQAPGTTRWKSVELMNGEQATVSIPGDIWAYAMTSLELMTDALPFSHITNETAVLAAVVLYQKRPLWETARAAGVDKKLWDLWERCWANGPELRPTTKRLLQDMKRILNACRCGRH